jgi:glyceraldehyde-3-phosphate dehydrogenase (NAD(P))
MSVIVHVVGTGTIGEPLIGILTDFRDRMGIDEVTFHKRTPLEFDKARINHLMGRGAKLAVDADRKEAFEALGHTVSYEAGEALERATVVIDCTPAGNENKLKFYEKQQGPKGFLAQGSEFGFGKPYARGVNDEALVPEEDRFVQIVSCNTHNITTLIRTLCDDGDSYCLEQGNFVCMRRANDVTQADKFIPAPYLGSHNDSEFGTHHARDAHHVFETLNQNLNLFSSAVKLNTQYMHSIWFRLALSRDISLEEVNARQCVEDVRSSGSVSPPRTATRCCHQWQPRYGLLTRMRSRSRRDSNPCIAGYTRRSSSAFHRGLSCEVGNAWGPRLAARVALASTCGEEVVGSVTRHGSKTPGAQ